MITRQKTKLRNAFENNVSTDIKLPKTQIFKMIQYGVFIGPLLSKLAGPLMKVGAPLAKNISAPVEIIGVASSTDAKIQKKIHGPGTATLTISNEERNDIMKIVQAFEDSNVLLKGITKAIENETTEQKGEFLGMLVGILIASLLGKFQQLWK